MGEAGAAQRRSGEGGHHQPARTGAHRRGPAQVGAQSFPLEANSRMDSYSRLYEIRWADLDANGHVNYAAYIDATADLRYRFFSEHGFPRERFTEMGAGP